jgi:hypothetical protein
METWSESDSESESERWVASAEGGVVESSRGRVGCKGTTRAIARESDAPRTGYV